MGPHPSLGDQARVFGRFVGTWDVEYTDFSKDGKVTHRSGEFIVGWVMDGRVIQDFWIVYPSGTRKDREVYTELRYYDPKSGTWPMTFIDPEHASAARFTGGAVGDDRIVLDTQDFDGEDTRWSFNDIRPDSFVWRDEAVQRRRQDLAVTVGISHEAARQPTRSQGRRAAAFFDEARAGTASARRVFPHVKRRRSRGNDDTRKIS